MVYRLRVVIDGVSPLIWRRLLVQDEITIARLHTVLQTAFGWSGEHLHRFVIHGTEYGISPAHLLLQVRARVLNDQLAADFHRWYPAFTHTPDTAALAA
jgi:hypothetical protein